MNIVILKHNVIIKKYDFRVYTVYTMPCVPYGRGTHREHREEHHTFPKDKILLERIKISWI